MKNAVTQLISKWNLQSDDGGQYCITELDMMQVSEGSWHVRQKSFQNEKKKTIEGSKGCIAAEEFQGQKAGKSRIELCRQVLEFTVRAELCGRTSILHG